MINSIPSKSLLPPHFWINPCLWAVVLLIIGILTRGLRFFGHFGLWAHWDEVRLAIPAIGILNGDFPINHLGVEYMGAFPSYLLAPWFIIFGSSTLSLDFFAYLVGLAVFVSSILVVQRLGGRQAGFWALVYLAIPPLQLNIWSVYGCLNYPFLLLLGNLLLLTLPFLFYRPSDNPLIWAAIGLLAGFGFWTNLLIVVYLVPVFLVFIRTGSLFRIRAWAFPAGFLLGGLPVWVYEALHFPSSRLMVHHGGTSGPFLNRVITLIQESLPRLIGVETGPLVMFILGIIFAAMIIGGLSISALAVIKDQRFGKRGRGSQAAIANGRWITGSVLAANLSIILLTARGNEIGGTGIRYLLPLYSLIPYWWGEAFQWLWGRRKGLTLLILIMILGYQAKVNWSDTLGSVPPDQRRWQAIHSQIDPLIAWLERNNINRVYFWNLEGFTPYEFTYLTGGRIVAADIWREEYLPYAVAVDAARSPAIITPAGGDSEVRESLLGMGYGLKETTVSSFKAIEPVPRFSSGFESINPDLWHITASVNPGTAPWLIDRDAATSWGTAGGQIPGQWIRVDLGKEEMVSRVDLLTLDWQEIPVGFRVEVSRDGLRWREAVNVPRYIGPFTHSEYHPFLKVRRGRVQAVFHPSRARFVKIIQTGSRGHHDWMIREIFVYRPAPLHSIAFDTPVVMAALDREKIDFLYTDYWLSAAVRETSRGGIGTLPANLYINSYGRAVPDPRELTPLKMQSGDAVWIGSDGDVDQVRKMLAPFKVPAKETTLAGTPLFIFQGPPPEEKPLSGEGWFLTGDERMAGDRGGIRAGDRHLILDPTKKNKGSDCLLLDFSSEQRIGRIQVVFKEGFPWAETNVEGSVNGQNWEGTGPWKWSGPLFWTGSELLKNSERVWDVSFQPHSWRFVRIITRRTEEPRLRIIRINCYKG
jgi:F5/8 type C domain-containing protein